MSSVDLFSLCPTFISYVIGVLFLFPRHVLFISCPLYFYVYVRCMTYVVSVDFPISCLWTVYISTELVVVD